MLYWPSLGQRHSLVRGMGEREMLGWAAAAVTANFQFNLAPFSERTTRRLPGHFPRAQNPVVVVVVVAVKAKCFSTFNIF